MIMQNSWRNPAVAALYIISALLLLNLIVLLSHGDAPSLIPVAMAQRQAPIAGGGGLFVMPAQLSGNTWGAYLMDIDKGTLSVYQFLPGISQLKFVAARKFTNDTLMENWNTLPSPQDVADLVEKQNKGIRAAAPPLDVPDDPSRKKDIP
jgi:hypothetical protein